MEPLPRPWGSLPFVLEPFVSVTGPLVPWLNMVPRADFLFRTAACSELPWKGRLRDARNKVPFPPLPLLPP
ncbi:hypothetical protein ASPCADRAFT_512547, partial [Aspergillus carbonarius ITEM 5010]